MEQTKVKRHRLNVPAADLNIAAAAIDSALNITPAKAAAAMGSRKHALAMLQGTNVIAGTAEGKRGSVLQKRSISLDATPLAQSDTASTVASLGKRKCPSGRSNWPKTAEERRLMELRKAELAQLREMELREVARREATVSGGGGFDLAGLFSDRYVPTEEEHRVLASLREAVAKRMGVVTDELDEPQACCTCVRDPNRGRLKAYEEESASLGASIAVKDNTAFVEFSVAQVQAPLKAGEMVVYPLGAPQRQPVGEWVITLFFRTKARAHGTTPHRP